MSNSSFLLNLSRVLFRDQHILLKTMVSGKLLLGQISHMLKKIKMFHINLEFKLNLSTQCTISVNVSLLFVLFSTDELNFMIFFYHSFCSLNSLQVLLENINKAQRVNCCNKLNIQSDLDEPFPGTKKKSRLPKTCQQETGNCFEGNCNL